MRYCKNCNNPENKCTCSHEDQDFVEEFIALELGIALAENIIDSSPSSDLSQDTSIPDASSDSPSFDGFGGGDFGGGGASSDF